MTFVEALARIGVSVDRTDLEPMYLEFLNQGIRDTASRHDFDQLKKTGLVIIPATNRTIALPPDFKSWQNGRFCVEVAIGAAPAVPVPVFTRTELERLSPVFRPALHLVFTQDNDAFQVTLPTAASAMNVLNLFYFGNPAKVTQSLINANPTLTTPLLRDYPNMVLSKVLSLIFQSINDPVYLAHDAAFEKEVAIATGDDIRDSNPAPDPNKE